MTRERESSGPPPGAARQGQALAGLVLILAGALVVVFSTFVSSSYDLEQALWSGLPVIDAGYWTGLSASNLASAPALERWLWIADVVVTLLCLASAVRACVALAGRRAPVWWPLFASGLAALVVFVVELVDWAGQGVLVFGLGLSVLGAAVVILGALLLATTPAGVRGDPGVSEERA